MTLKALTVVLLLVPAIALAQVRQRYTKSEVELHLRNASRQLVVQLLGNPAGSSKLGQSEILVFCVVIFVKEFLPTVL